MNQPEETCLCEAADCSLPGTVCPACLHCYCFPHLQRSSCEICRRIVTHHSFEHQFGRLLSIGAGIILCGLLCLTLPRDPNGIIIQLALTLLVLGILFCWIGLLARM